MTSRYGSELGITDWIHPRNEAKLGLAPKWVTWPEQLAASGYHNGLVGKWHLGVPAPFHPTKTGFHYFMGFLEGGTSPKDPRLEVKGKTARVPGLCTDLLTDDALKFLERAPKKQPFLLSLHFRAPHARWLPVQEQDWKPFANLDPVIPNPDYPKLNVPRVKLMTREYLASVKSVDRSVGRVLDKLAELKLADNTLVIFTSDHGYNMGHNGIWHKGNGHWVLTTPPPATKNVPKGQRPNMYDHSIRVPTIVRWPGVVKPGTVVHETVTNLDWYPTIVEAAQIQAGGTPQLRGRSIIRLLQGEKVKWDNDLYCEYSTHHQSKTHMRMYRTPRWKLVRDFLNPSRDEFYDLKNDPNESKNLIASENAEVQSVIKDLHAKILARMKANGDKVATAQ